MKQDIIQLEARGEFPFTFYIEKAIAKDDEDELIIEGIASTTNVDHDNERMSKDALHSMATIINKDGVPLRVEHQKEGDAIIGTVFKGWVDERDQLHIRARLKKDHPVSPILHHSMKNGLKMGLSVGGVVKHALKEFAESVGGIVKTFYEVALQEVSVTPRPANYDSWLIAKSIAKDPKDAEQYGENMGLRREFLFENSQLDYLQAFAKSVPDKAWRKVESPKTINKDDKHMKKDEKDTGDDETDATKAVSRAEFSSLGKAVKGLSQLVAKGFESMGHIMSKAMDGDAMDQANPDKKKPEDEQQTAKMDNNPLEQANPNKDKPDESEQQTAKGEDDEETTKDGTDDEKETTKVGDEETTETKARKKAKAESEGTQTYDLDTVTRSIHKLGRLEKRVARMSKDDEDKETTTTKDSDDTDETPTQFKSRHTRKTDTDDEKETTKDGDDEKETTTKDGDDDDKETTTKGIHPLDMFVVKMTALLENVVTKMEKSGKRVIGFEKSFIEDLQKSPEVQSELARLIKQPGFKKSVAMGVPYMVTKEGHRLPLQAIPEQVEKSVDDKPKDFKSEYKSKYSSVSEQDR